MRVVIFTKLGTRWHCSPSIVHASARKGKTMIKKYTKSAQNVSGARRAGRYSTWCRRHSIRGVFELGDGFTSNWTLNPNNPVQKRRVLHCDNVVWNCWWYCWVSVKNCLNCCGYCWGGDLLLLVKVLFDGVCINFEIEAKSSKSKTARSFY